MQTMSPRFHLSVGFTHARSLRIATEAFLGVLITASAAFVGYMIGQLVMWGIADSIADEAKWLPPLVAVILMVPAALCSVLMVAAVVCRGAWLSGTQLTVRVLRQRTVDLATARSVALDMVPRPRKLAPPLPQLSVVGADGRTLRLRLASREGHPLPQEQLLGLATVLSTARYPGAAETVSWLRDAAAQAIPTVRRLSK
ncbi:hypothetical protein ACWDV4_03735 [Micromonospora sp. NPDC003197]